MGLSIGPRRLNPARVERGEDKLLGIIRRYEADIKQISATSPITDKQLDAMMDFSTDRLAEAIGVPALTAASALAAFEMLRKDYFSLRLRMQ